MAVQEAELTTQRLIDAELDLSRSLLDQIRIVGSREGGMVEAMVPASFIDREEVPVNKTHVRTLRNDIADRRAKGEGSGQLVPILLAHMPTREKFAIADGFHRDGAMHELGDEEVFATIRRNTTEEELIDLRIKATHSHEEISFARSVEWIKKAWELTPWAKEFSAVDAFIFASKGEEDQPLQLSAEDAEAIRAWTADKSMLWLMAQDTIRDNLEYAEIADPELVTEVRSGKAAKDGNAITLSHLKAIIKPLPGRFLEQQLVAEILRMHHYSAERAGVAALKISKARDFNHAVEIFHRTDWKRLPLKPTHKPGLELVKEREQPAPEAHPEGSTARLSRELLLTEIRFGKMAVRSLVKGGEYVIPSPVNHDQAPRFVVEYGGDHDITNMLNPPSWDRAAATFHRRAIDVQQAMVSKAAQRTQMSRDRVVDMFQNVSERIEADFQSGALRYVPDLQAPHYDMLLRVNLQREIRRTRSIFVTQPDASRGHRVDPARIGLVPVLEAMPSLSDKQRQLLVLEGFMRLSRTAVQQASGWTPETRSFLSTNLYNRFVLRKDSQADAELIDFEQGEATA